MLAQQNKQKGFTLVELAIVLVIVGLLIGGILKGQQLMENASITATVSQIKGIEAATTSFLDSYGALPGDLLDSDSKIAGCAPTGLEYLCVSGTGDKFKLGDGIVGSVGWDLITYQPGLAANAADLDIALEGGFETLLFWHSLQQAGLINAIKDTAIYNEPRAFGVSVPRAEVSGGFWVGYTDSAGRTMPDTVGGGPTDYSLLGTIVALVGDPSTIISTTVADMNAVVPSVAAAIDRKMDDGIPSSGYVQAFGANQGVANGGCVSGHGSSMLYNEGNSQLDCGVYINIVPQN